MQAQLEKEAAIRRKVEELKGRIIRGLNLVDSIVKARSEALSSHLSSIISLLLAGAFSKAVTLVGEAAFRCYVVSALSAQIVQTLMSRTGTIK